MIAHLKGKLEHIDKDHIVIEVNGVGYRVNLSPTVLSRLPKVGSELMVFTYQVVREDELSLYGFLTKEERNLFSTLLTVSGIGPKGASVILSSAPLDKLVAAITRGDAEFISSSPGIGLKTAQKVVIELKEKLAKAYGLKPAQLSMGGESTVISDSISALITLGYSPKEAREAVSKIDPENSKSVEEVVKSALKGLG
ncbi:Holliday junction branch migration protein RuvA [Candidatus Saganbacteria bacterium]|nr:Holliday junction branch migration protein RuvA [Candidatus Saganbacteria bacterium]